MACERREIGLEVARSQRRQSALAVRSRSTARRHQVMFPTLSVEKAAANRVAAQNIPCSACFFGSNLEVGEPGIPLCGSRFRTSDCNPTVTQTQGSRSRRLTSLSTRLRGPTRLTA